MSTHSVRGNVLKISQLKGKCTAFEITTSNYVIVFLPITPCACITSYKDLRNRNYFIFTYLLQTNALGRVSLSNLGVASESFQEVHMQCKVLGEIIHPLTIWKFLFSIVCSCFLIASCGHCETSPPNITDACEERYAFFTLISYYSPVISGIETRF